MRDGFLRGALIGCGYIAPRHLTAWKQIDAAEIVAVCDLDHARAQELAQAYGINAAFSSVDELWQALGGELDFVDLSVPPGDHRALVAEALDRGLHVLCQKPMAETIADSQAIVQMAQTSSHTVAINEIWKWMPAYEHVWRLLQEQALGEIIAVRFGGATNLLLPRSEGSPPSATLPRFQPMSQLIVLEYGIHILDMMRAWFGEPVALRASVSRVHPELSGDDGATIDLRFPEFTAEVAIDFCAPGPPTADNLTGERLAIRGTRGLVTVEEARTVTLHLDGARPHRIHYAQDQRDAGFERSHRDFAEAALNGGVPMSGPADAIKSQSLMLACYESAGGGAAWVEAPSDLVSRIVGRGGS